METLPPELLYEIVSYLTPNDMRRLRSTNKNLNDIFATDKFFTKLPTTFLDKLFEYLPTEELIKLRETNLYLNNILTLQNIRDIRINKLKNFNPLHKLIELYPDWNWDWDEISANINTYWDTENDLNVRYWSMWGLSINPNITIDIIVNNIDENWDWDQVSRNQSITINDILKYPNLPWNWDLLSTHKNISLDIINKYPQLPFNPTLKISSIEPTKQDLETKLSTLQFLHLYDDEEIYLSKYLIDFMERYPHLNWNDMPLSINKYITWEDVITHQEIDWDYNILSANKNITFKIMIEHPQFDWVYSYNPNLTFNDIVSHPEINWDARYISKCNLGTT